MSKCNRKRACEAMDKYLQRGAFGSRQKGLCTATLMNLKTGKRRTVTLYRGSAKDAGIILNLCPFCGGKING